MSSLARIFALFAIGFPCLFPLGCKKGEQQPSSSAKIDVASNSALTTPENEDPHSAGKQAVNFSLKDLSGKENTLADFRGKLTLLNFWATWCVLCVAEMPALQRLHKMFESQGFQVLAINVDPAESEATVRKFLSDRGISFPVLLDPQMSLPEQYGLTGFPESFFIGPDLKFIGVVDPDSMRQGVRLISDRPWDSPVYVELVRSLLGKFIVDTGTPPTRPVSNP